MSFGGLRVEGSVGTPGAMGTDDTGLSAGSVFLQHPGEWNGVAVVSYFYNYDSGSAMDFRSVVGGANVSRHIELQTADAKRLGRSLAPPHTVVGGADGIASGCWTGLGVDRFVSR